MFHREKLYGPSWIFEFLFFMVSSSRVWSSTSLFSSKTKPLITLLNGWTGSMSLGSGWYSFRWWNVVGCVKLFVKILNSNDAMVLYSVYFSQSSLISQRGQPGALQHRSPSTVTPPVDDKNSNMSEDVKRETFDIQPNQILLECDLCDFRTTDDNLIHSHLAESHHSATNQITECCQNIIDGSSLWR